MRTKCSALAAACALGVMTIAPAGADEVPREGLPALSEMSPGSFPFGWAAPGASLAEGAETQTSPGDELLTKAAELGAPQGLIDALEAADTAGFTYRRDVAWPDVTGNGLDDVMEMGIFEAPVGDSGRLELKLRDGLTGQPLWDWSGNYVEGFMIPVPARVGRAGHNGVLVVKFQGPQVGFIGISSRGEIVYEKNFDYLTDSDEGSFVSFDLFNGLKGDATDILLGMERGTHPLVPVIGNGPTLGVGASIIDGRNGKIVRHEAIEPRVTEYPELSVTPDLDGDGLDDYIAFPVTPDVNPDPNSQEPLLPDLSKKYMRARKGTDGKAIWQSQPMDIEDVTTAAGIGGLPGSPESYRRITIHTALGDLAGGKRKDLVLQVQDVRMVTPDDSEISSRLLLIEGNTGWVRWQLPGQNPMAIGDIDRDGKDDLLTSRELVRKRHVRLKIRALDGGTGKGLYERTFALKKKMPPDSSTHAFVYPAGDVEPDRLPEVAVYLSWHAENDGAEDDDELAYRHFYIHAKNAKRLPVRSKGLAVAVPIDGKGDDFGRLLYDKELPWYGVHFFSGTTQKKLLQITVPEIARNDSRYFWTTDFGNFDDDRCADLLIELGNGSATFALVIDGGDGKVLWSQKRKGLLGALPELKVQDRNQAC